MNNFRKLLTIVATVAFAPPLLTAATTSGGNSADSQRPAAVAQFLKSVPAADPKPEPSKSHTFRVNDEKGPLLTCVAPNIESDPNTDVFKDCVLAPGRTLDEMMHTFVGAIHYEQNQEAQERAAWHKEMEERDEKAATKSAQK